MGVPLGHRYRVSSRRVTMREDFVLVKRITKSAVDEIIFGGDFECFYKRENDSDFKEYDGCLTNLSMILHDGKTKVKVAGSRTPGYLDGYRTIVMTAPCFPATILLRTKI